MASSRKDWLPPVGLALAGLAVALSAAGCSGESDLGPGVAARIDGRDVAYSRFESYVAEATGDDASGLDSSVLSALFEQFLEQELLHRLAVDRKLIEEDESAEEAARRLLEESALPSPDEAEVAAYYRDHAADFELGERVLLRQVLVQDPATAQTVRAELASGTSFETLTARYAEDDDAVFVGERGELMRSQLPVVFVEPIDALAEGETSEVLEADYGFHIFQVVAKRAPGVQPIGEVEDKIRRQIRRLKATERLAELVTEARDRYNLLVAERNLPFAL